MSVSGIGSLRVLRRLLAATFGTLVLAGATSATACAGASWAQPDPPGSIGADVPLYTAPIIDRGRAWWVRGTQSRSLNWTLYSRALRGGPLRSVALHTGELERPPGNDADGNPFNSIRAIGSKLHDGRFLLQAAWGTDLDAPGVDPSGGVHDSSPTGLLAAFDATTGALIGQQMPPVDPTGLQPRAFVDGTPGVMRDRATTDLAGQQTVDWRLSDPMTGVPFAGSGSVVRGPWVLGYSSPGVGAWSAGTGDLRVADLVTGTERYRLRAVQIARLAGGASRVRTTVRLQANGGLLVIVRRISGHGLVPVTVDAAGRPRRGGPRVARATRIATVTGARRTFVSVSGQRTSGPRPRRCHGLWVTDREGRRGARLATGDGVRDRRDVPDYWDGRYAAWRTSGGVRTDSGLQALHLTRSQRPAC